MLEGLSHLFTADRPTVEMLRDFGDIFIVAFILYRALVVLKGTRAMQMGIGFLVFGALYLLAKYAELATLMQVLSWLASSSILIMVVVFQNDIRRALVRVGEKAWLRRGENPQERLIDDVVAAATDLARHRMGALICLERDANVYEFVQNDGIKLDALVTKELLVSLFIPEAQNKTHDGAVIISNLRITHAGIMFPMSETKNVTDATFGSRHRAAISITEETDVVVVVVSEERGAISLVYKGDMEKNLSGDALRERLLDMFGRPAAKKATKLPFRRGRKTSPSLSVKPATEKKEPKSDKKAEKKGDKKAEKKGDKKAEKKGESAAISKPGSKKPTLPSRNSVIPPPSERSPNLAEAVKTNKQSGGFRPLRRDDSSDELPVAARVSVPMPSSKDRKSTDPSERKSTEPSERKSTDPSDRITLASDDDSPPPAPAAAKVSKPMTPTELRGTPLPTSAPIPSPASTPMPTTSGLPTSPNESSER